MTPLSSIRQNLLYGFICLLSLTLPAVLSAQKTTQQVADEYKKKIEEAKSPAEKMRLAKELQDVLLPKPYQDGTISAQQLSTMYDKKYRVRLNCSSKQHSSSTSKVPCPSSGTDDGQDNIMSDFVVVMHRNYSSFAASASGKDLENFSASGSGSMNSVDKSCSGTRTCKTTTHVNMNAEPKYRIFNFFYNQNDNTWQFSIEVPSLSHTVCTGHDSGENDGGDSYLYSCNQTSEGFHCTEKDGKFVIDGQHTESSSDAAAGTESDNTYRIHAELVPYSDMKYDAYILPIKANTNSKQSAIDYYQKWLPIGRTIRQPSTDYGNYISFRIKIVDREHPENELGGKPYQVHWTLDSVSRLPGDCMNFPLLSSDQSEDLYFDPKDSTLPDGMQKATNSELLSAPDNGAACIASVLCRDYGAYGRLQAHITLRDDSRSYELDAHLSDAQTTEISIPYDENHNHIADQWEKDSGIYGQLLGENWDEETQPGNEQNGDGFTLFEEYRGVMIHDTLMRMNPKQKEVFIVNNSTTFKDAQMAEFDNLTGGKQGIHLHAIYKSELNSELVVNCNKCEFTGGAQHAIRIEDKEGTAAEAQAFGKCVAKGGDEARLHSPKDVDYIWLRLKHVHEEYAFVKNISGFIAHTALHEIAHALGVPHHNGDVSVQYRPMNQIADFNESNTIVYDQRVGKQSSWAEIAKDGQEDWNAYDMHLSPATESSGDVYCLMCYNSMASYAVYRARYTSASGKLLTLIIRNGLKDEIHSRFCTANTSAGTEWNSDSNSFTVKVEGVDIKETLRTFGSPDQGGECMKRFRVKDWGDSQ